MFAVPNPAPILSKKEIDDLKGKLKRFSRFLRRQRSKFPELHVPLQNLLHLIRITLIWELCHYSQELRAGIEKNLRNIAVLENALVQVAVQKKDYLEVFEAAGLMPNGIFID